jgi:hypothetical protein
MTNIYSPLDVDSDYFLTHDEEHELFYAKLNKLPEPLQDILLNLNTEEALASISNRFRLNRDQIIAMTRLVRDITLTDVYFGEMVNQLKSGLAVNEDVAKNMAAALISQVFVQVLEDIKRLHKAKFGKEEPSANPHNVLDLRNK